MSRLALRIAAAFVGVTIGVAAAYVYSIVNQPSEKTISTDEDHLAQGIAEKKRTYELREQALGDVSGYRTCFSTFESSDGMIFETATIPYDSSKRARSALETNLREAVEIIEREDLFDEKGRKVGKKVVATFPRYDGSPTVSAKILWTRGSHFGYIRSVTLSNILEYRKDTSF